MTLKNINKSWYSLVIDVLLFYIMCKVNHWRNEKNSQNCK